jgi:hypothetical protein
LAGVAAQNAGTPAADFEYLRRESWRFRFFHHTAQDWPL